MQSSVTLSDEIRREQVRKALSDVAAFPATAFETEVFYLRTHSTEPFHPFRKKAGVIVPRAVRLRSASSRSKSIQTLYFNLLMHTT